METALQYEKAAFESWREASSTACLPAKAHATCAGFGIIVVGSETSGWSVVAKLIVTQADKTGRFFPINCGAISENLIQSELFGHRKGSFTGADRDKKGIFEAAAGGFVFLDEIGDMPLSQQPKLLRALQERKIQRVGEVEEFSVNFRTISATHITLRSAVDAKQFREDLFFRISKEVITIPPLRDRVEDINQLVAYFLSKHPKRCVIADDAVRLLQAYDWPGNIRQLESIVESMIIRSDGVIRAAHVLKAIPELSELGTVKIKRTAFGSLGVQLLNQERAKFQKAILAANGDRNRAAQSLGIPRSTFFRKAKELGLVKTRRQNSLTF